MRLMKSCSICGRKHPYDTHCSHCGNRYKRYDKSTRNKVSSSFYKTVGWRTTSEAVRAKYNYIDVYAYYKYNKIIPSDCVHHIIPLSEDYDRRLDTTNLIPLSHQSHMEIEAMYRSSEKSKRYMIQYLEDIVGAKGGKGGQKSF